MAVSHPAYQKKKKNMQNDEKSSFPHLPGLLSPFVSPPSPPPFRPAMSSILRKIVELASPRPPSAAGGAASAQPSSSRGGFEKLPENVLLQILRLLGPKDAMRMSLVCKSWRSLVSNYRFWLSFLHEECPNQPWESIVFAETFLRHGYPILTVPSEVPEQSFMRMYSQRAQVQGAVIIDGGSGYCKYGWSKYDRPSGRSATFLEFGNIESPMHAMHARLRHFFATMYSRMQVRPSMQPIVVSIPICHYDDTESAKASRRQLIEAIYSTLFEMNVPEVCAINQATLSLYAARRISGISINIGFQATSIVPILHGKVMRKIGVEVTGLGALKLTGFLRELMQQKNMSFESLYTIRTLKEKLCYVAADYEAELRKNTEATYEHPVEGSFTLSRERFQTGEILFQPRMAGVQTMSLHQAVALCIEHCHDAELNADDTWFKTVVLSGGTACLPGLAERLEKELHGLLPPSISSGIRIVTPHFGADTAWFGAKLITNLSTFPGPWCLTKKKFRQKSRFNLLW